VCFFFVLEKKYLRHVLQKSKILGSGHVATLGVFARPALPSMASFGQKWQQIKSTELGVRRDPRNPSHLFRVQKLNPSMG